MSGRGRGMPVPAWMQRQGQGGPPPASQGPPQQGPPGGGPPPQNPPPNMSAPPAYQGPPPGGAPQTGPGGAQGGPGMPGQRPPMQGGPPANPAGRGMPPSQLPPPGQQPPPGFGGPVRGPPPGYGGPPPGMNVPPPGFMGPPPGQGHPGQGPPPGQAPPQHPQGPPPGQQGPPGQHPPGQGPPPGQHGPGPMHGMPPSFPAHMQPPMSTPPPGFGPPPGGQMPMQGQPPLGMQPGAPMQQQQPPSQQMLQQSQQQAPPQAQQAAQQSQPQSAPAKPLWSEHVDKNSGRTYYYNSVTKQSSWTKPADYVPPDGATNSSSPQASTPAAQAQAQQPAASSAKSASGWKEYTSPDGRKYYHNASTGVTQWHKPADFDAPADASKPAADNVNGKAEDKSSSGATDSAKPQEEDVKEKEEVEKKRKQTAKERERERQLEAEKEKERMKEFEKQLAEVKYESKEEALAAFKAMLEDKVTSHTMTWQELVPLCQYDVRFRALKSTGEKKNVFQHFITQKQKEFIDKERIRKKEAKEAFIQLLEESEFIDHKARLRDVSKDLSKDPRFKAVESERERSELFEDYVMKLEKKEKERLKAARTENLKAFVELLEETPDLTSKSRWSEVKAIIKDDPRYLALEGDDKYRLGAFDDYMQTLARKEAEEKELARERRRLAEKAQRAAMQELLTELNAKSIVTAKTAWKDIEEEPAFCEDPRMQAMLVEQSKGKVMDTFDDFVEELNRKFLADRPALKDAYKAATALDVLVCGPQGFEDAIREHRDAHDVSAQHIELFYKELLKLAQEEEAKKERRKQRNYKEFSRLIRKYIERGKLEENATYEQAAEACKDRSAWKDIASSERPALFEKAMEEAKAAAKDDDRRSRSRSRSRSPKKRRDRSSSHSRSEAKKPKRDTEDGEIEEGEA